MNKDNCSAVDDGLSNSAIVIRDFIELCDIPEDSIKYDFFYWFYEWDRYEFRIA